MTYNPSDPVAKCDSCGQELVDGDKAYSLTQDWYPTETILLAPVVHLSSENMRGHDNHYCCVTPCLEKGLITSLRSTLSTPPKQSTPVPESLQ